MGKHNHLRSAVDYEAEMRFFILYRQYSCWNWLTEMTTRKALHTLIGKVWGGGWQELVKLGSFCFSCCRGNTSLQFAERFDDLEAEIITRLDKHEKSFPYHKSRYNHFGPPQQTQTTWK